MRSKCSLFASEILTVLRSPPAKDAKSWAAATLISAHAEARAATYPKRKHLASLLGIKNNDANKNIADREVDGGSDLDPWGTRVVTSGVGMSNFLLLVGDESIIKVEKGVVVVHGDGWGTTGRGGYDDYRLDRFRHTATNTPTPEPSENPSSTPDHDLCARVRSDRAGIGSHDECGFCGYRTVTSTLDADGDIPHYPIGQGLDRTDRQRTCYPILSRAHPAGDRGSLKQLPEWEKDFVSSKNALYGLDCPLPSSDQ